MSKMLAALLASLAVIGAAPAAPPAVAQPAEGPVAVVAKTCSGSYVHAKIGGKQKCLRAGEFCTHHFDRRYRHYGYRCTRYYRNVHRYRLTYA
jgi:hypothetical protein